MLENYFELNILMCFMVQFFNNIVANESGHCLRLSKKAIVLTPHKNTPNIIPSFRFGQEKSRKLHFYVLFLKKTGYY